MARPIGDKLIIGAELKIPKMRIWTSSEAKARGEPPLVFERGPEESESEFTARVQIAIDNIANIAKSNGG